MKTYNTDVRAFYNPDCGKYGVEKIVEAYTINDRLYFKWTQIEIPGVKNVYTPYAGVAKRWADKIRDKRVIEVRALMMEQEDRDERTIA